MLFTALHGSHQALSRRDAGPQASSYYCQDSYGVKFASPIDRQEFFVEW